MLAALHALSQSRAWATPTRIRIKQEKEANNLQSLWSSFVRGSSSSRDTSQWPAAAPSQTQPTAGRPPVTGQRTKPRRRLLLARTWCGSHEILWRPRRQSLPLLLRSRATVFPVPCRGRSVLCCVLSLIPEDERWCFRSVKMAVTCPLYRRKVICLGVPSSSARAPRSACVVLLCPR
jgi:hypothetical protein